MLSPGTVLGSYQILSALGAGGMGEVYRARDAKLGRDVAIKILPEAFAADPDRLARFQREAQVLAALNHPNIAAIHGLDDSNGLRFLVLELVDGEALDARLKGGALPFDEALAIARQIVDALEAAHEKGIIHRDLKPANVMLTSDGRVKVLDFGLAKIEANEAGASGALSHSPTLTFAATQAGVILGTAAYMSPEQAKGRPTDKRSDVWSFGCVLFEMLSGKRAFEGEDVSDTLAAILRGDPDWNALPAAVPPHIRSILERCLQKDRKTRIPDLSVVRFLMDDGSLPASAPSLSSASPITRLSIGWQAAAAVLFVATAVSLAGWWYASRRVEPAITRFFVYPPDKAAFMAANGLLSSGRISPDGKKLAFTARDAAGKQLLWVRPLDGLIAQPLADTDAATNPFWSPDSRFIAYFVPGKLMKVAAAGGPPQTVCAAMPGNRGGAWNRDGVIVMNGGPSAPLKRVPAAGGDPSPALRLMPGQTSHVFPWFLPDGHHVLFYAYGATDDANGIYVGSLDTGESTRIAGADSGAVFAPTGYLLFVRQGTLLAQRFSSKTRTLSEDPFPVAEHVESSGVPGFVSFSVSDNGALVYGIGSGRSSGVQMVLVDRGGKSVASYGPFANYRGIDLSTDGHYLAAHRHDGTGGDLWVTDVVRGTTSRLTFDPLQDNSSPAWSPDGSQIAFASRRNGKWGLYRKAATGAGTEERLLESDTAYLPQSWSPDGRAIVAAQLDTKLGVDLWMLPVSTSNAADTKPVPLLRTTFNEDFGQISSDGKWLAYMSNETGRAEVYVQPFPTGSGKWQVSTNGGTFPRWRRDGRELFYMDRTSAGKMIAVDVNGTASVFVAGSPKELFDSGYLNLGHTAPYLPFAVSADGQRFLIPRGEGLSTADAISSPIAVVLNWDAGLKK
jgi:serine/threonine protein kinase/Tol biopolymer transport system component